MQSSTSAHMKAIEAWICQANICAYVRSVVSNGTRNGCVFPALCLFEAQWWKVTSP